MRASKASLLPYRERFKRTLESQDCDRPPMDLAGTDMTQMEGGPRRLAPLLGLDASTPGEELDEEVLKRLDIDVRCVGGVLHAAPPRKVSDNEVVDCWGIKSQFNGHHYEMVERPLAGASVDDLKSYPWPDPASFDKSQLDKISEKAKRLYEESPYVVCGRHPYYGVFELSCWLCGFDDLLYRMAAEPEFVQELFSIILDYQGKVDELYYGRIGRYIHYTTSGDDFGTQKAPFMSPGMFKEQIAPFMAKRIKRIASYTDAAFFHHSCGAIRPLIPELISAGVQILNPIQPGAEGMEPEGLKRDFGSKLCFYGGVDTQELLPKGSPEEVRAEVERLLGIMAKDGGYVLSPAHCFIEDVPAENILAVYEAGQAWASRRA